MQNSFEHILQAGGMSDERPFRSEAAHWNGNAVVGFNAVIVWAKAIFVCQILILEALY